MGVQYQWITKGEKPCFACSRWDGQIFSSADSLPELPVHPNCSCVVKAFDTNAKPLESVVGEVEELVSEAIKLTDEFRSFLNREFIKRLWPDIKTSLYALEQVIMTGQIFLNNFLDMREAWVKGADKYFHSKANAQSAQLGKIGERTAEFISEVREFTDYYKYIIKNILILRDMSYADLLKDIAEDKKANAYGRYQGRGKPVSGEEPDIEIYRPDKLDKNKY